MIGIPGDAINGIVDTVEGNRLSEFRANVKIAFTVAHG